jgi:hypothetical protein
MSRDRSRCPASGPSHRDRIPAGIPGRLPARRAPDVTGQDLGSLIAEVAQQHVGAGSDSEGEVPAVVLAELQVGDPFQKLINHILGARSHFRGMPVGLRCSHPRQQFSSDQENPQEQATSQQVGACPLRGTSTRIADTDASPARMDRHRRQAHGSAHVRRAA